MSAINVKADQVISLNDAFRFKPGNFKLVFIWEPKQHPLRDLLENYFYIKFPDPKEKLPIDFDVDVMIYNNAGVNTEHVFFANAKSQNSEVAIQEFGPRYSTHQEAVCVDINKITASSEYITFSLKDMRDNLFNKNGRLSCLIVDHKERAIIKYEIKKKGEYKAMHVATIVKNDNGLFLIPRAEV